MLETRSWSCVTLRIVMGALGTVTGNVKRNLDDLGINLSVDALQKTCLLGTARILWKFIDILWIERKKGFKRQKREDWIDVEKEVSLSS